MTIASLAPPSARASADPLTRASPPVSWVSLAVLAIVVAYVDGFVVTSLHGAVGAAASDRAPFLRWLRDSTMMLPPLVLSLRAALSLTHRWVGRSRGELVHLAGAAVLIIAISTALGMVEVTVNAATDYTAQESHFATLHSIHTTTVAVDAGAVAAPNPGSCISLCAARRATLMAHVRGASEASIVLLLTNLVLVLWVLALRGGRLWTPLPAPAAEH